MNARARLEAMLSPELLSALDEHVRELVDERLAAHTAANGDVARRWLTLDEAGERLGCSADAVRMRVRRGRLEARRQGARLYVRAESVDRLG